MRHLLSLSFILLIASLVYSQEGRVIGNSQLPDASVQYAKLTSAVQDSIKLGRVKLISSKPNPVTAYLGDNVVIDTVGLDSVWIWGTSRYQLLRGSNWTRRGNTLNYTAGKVQIGPDSSFVHDPLVDTTFIQGNTRITGNLHFPSSGRIGLGTNAPAGAIHSVSETDSGGPGEIFLQRSVASFRAPFFNFRKSTGTASAPLPPNDGNRLGTFQFQGWDGSAWQNGTTMFSEVLGMWSASNRGAGIRFQATRPNNNVAEDAFLIRANAVQTLMNTKLVAGADSSFIHNPAVDTTAIKGTLKIIHTGTPALTLTGDNGLVELGDGNSIPLRIFRYNGNASINAFSAAGGKASPTFLSNTSPLGRLTWNAWKGPGITSTAFTSTARIEAIADTAHSATTLRTALRFLLASSTQVTGDPLERMRLTTRGLGINNSNPQYSLDLFGADAIRLPSVANALKSFGRAGRLHFNTDSSAVEIHDGTADQILATRNWVRSNFQNRNFTQKTSVTAANISTETNITESGFATIPANSLRVGTTIKFTAYGSYQVNGTSTSISLRSMLGSTVVASNGTTASNEIITPQLFKFEGVITIRTIGASGSFSGACQTFYYTSSNTFNSLSTIPQSGTLDTTISQAFNIQAFTSIAHPNSSFTLHNCVLEIINP